MSTFNTGLTSNLFISKLGVPNGIAELGADGLVKPEQLPDLSGTGGGQPAYAYAVSSSDNALTAGLSSKITWDGQQTLREGMQILNINEGFILPNISSYHLIVNASIQSNTAQMAGRILITSGPSLRDFAPIFAFRTSLANQPYQVHFSTIITTLSSNTTLSVEVIPNENTSLVKSDNRNSTAFPRITNVLIQEIV